MSGTVTLSNVSLSNSGEYVVSSSNPSGTITINQATSVNYLLQYKADILATRVHNYITRVGDTSSNVQLTLNNSNLSISISGSNVFSTADITPYISTGYNTLTLNRTDNSLNILLNSTNLVQVTNSNILPSGYNNGTIQITASNSQKVKDIVYQCTGVFTNSVLFQQPIKATSITSTTIICSNVQASNITALSNTTANASNVAYWSSNNLYLKAGGTISGNVGIKVAPSYELDIAGKGMRLQGGAGDTPTVLYHNSTEAGNTHSVIQFVNNGHYIACTDSNWNSLGKAATSGHNIFYASAGHTFAGVVKINDALTGAPVTALSNVAMYGSNTAVWSSNIATYSSNVAMYGSNTAVWSSNIATYSSNTLVKKTGDYMAYLSTDKITLPAGANLIGSGWDYSSGWVASGALGGYVLRNNGVGGLEVYTGLSNSLGMAITVASNGYIGIGTYTPTNRLDVSGVIQNTVAGGANTTFTVCERFKCDATEAYFYWRNSNLGIDLTNPLNNLGSTKRHIIFNEYADATSGFVGIGTSSPSTKLDVNGTINATNYTGTTITNLSNLGVWSSNTARWSSNYGATLCNYTTDAYNKAQWGSNNMGKLVGASNFFSPTEDGTVLYHRDVTTPSVNYAFGQFNTGKTVINSTYSNGIEVREGNNVIATFKDSKLKVGWWTDPQYTLDVEGDARITSHLTLKKGFASSTGTFTHLPYSGDNKNYIRGTTIIADAGGFVGVGTASPSYQFDVLGKSRISSLIIGSGNIKPVTFILTDSVSIGTNGTSKKTNTITLGSAYYPPDTNYTVFLDYQSANDDIFVGKIRNKSTTGFDIVTYRVDGSGWATAPTVYFTMVGFE